MEKEQKENLVSMSDKKSFEVRLEYNERTGHFHEEMYHEGKTLHDADTYGWETIADHVSDRETMKFCCILDIMADTGLLPKRILTKAEVDAFWFMFTSAEKDLGELIEMAKQANPERYE
jgi:hypothetical protein